MSNTKIKITNTTNILRVEVVINRQEWVVVRHPRVQQAEVYKTSKGGLEMYQGLLYDPQTPCPSILMDAYRATLNHARDFLPVPHKMVWG